MVAPTAKPSYHFSGRRRRRPLPITTSYHLSLFASHFGGGGAVGDGEGPSHPLRGSSPKGGALKQKNNADDQWSPYGEVTNDTNKKVQENVKNYFILLKYFLDLFSILC